MRFSCIFLISKDKAPCPLGYIGSFLNLAYNLRRDDRRRKEVPLDPNQSFEKDWEGSSNAKIEVEQILEALSDEDRVFLELCKQECSQAEIAVTLGISQPSVAIRKRRLFRRLARKYESGK